MEHTSTDNANTEGSAQHYVRYDGLNLKVMWLNKTLL